MISVILCTYNRARLLSRPLDSLRRQRYRDFELVVVDDGSTDETREILPRLVEGLGEVKMERNPRNLGHPAARNRGLHLAEREWVTFLDSDDAYHEDHLALLAEAVREHPQTDLFHADAEIIGDPTVPDRHDPTRRIRLDECVIGGTFFFRRKKALAVGGFPAVSFADDAAFFDLIRAQGWKITLLPHRTYRYFRGEPDAQTKPRDS